MKLELRIPMRAVTSQNARFMNPFARAAVVKKERRLTRQAFEAASGHHVLGDTSTGRWRVVMTRIGPNELDNDNNAGALKAVRDEIAELLGRNDRDPELDFVPLQRSEGHVSTRTKSGRKSKVGIYAVEVLIQRQFCPDCHVEHCDCIHLEALCADCSAFMDQVVDGIFSESADA